MTITDRQKQALTHVANGDNIDQTADKMNLSRSTIEKHLRAARIRLNAKNLVHTVYIATKRGLLMLLCSVLLVSDTVDINDDPARLTGRLKVRTMRVKTRRET